MHFKGISSGITVFFLRKIKSEIIHCNYYEITSVLKTLHLLLVPPPGGQYVPATYTQIIGK